MRKERALRIIGLVLGLTALTAVLLGPTAPTSASSNTSVSVVPSAQTVGPGDNVDVAVQVSSDVASRGVQFDVDFDHAAMTFLSATEGTYYSDWATGHGDSTNFTAPTESLNGQSGHLAGAYVYIDGTTAGGPTGTGTAVTLHFKAANANNMSSLHLSKVVVGDASGFSINSVVVNDGAVYIGAGVSIPSSAHNVGDNFDVSAVVATNVASRGAQFTLDFDPTVLQFRGATQGTFYSDWASAHSDSTTAGTPTEGPAGHISGASVSITGGTAGGPTGSGTLFTLHFRAIGNGVSPLNVVTQPNPPNVTVFDASSTPIPGPFGKDGSATVGESLSVSPSYKALSTGTAFDLSVVVNSALPSRGAQIGLTFDHAAMDYLGYTEGTFYSNWALANGDDTLVSPAPSQNPPGNITDVAVSISGTTPGGPTGTGTLVTFHFKSSQASVDTLVNLVDVQMTDANGMTFSAAGAVNGEVVVVKPPASGSSSVGGVAEFPDVPVPPSAAATGSAQASNAGELAIVGFAVAALLLALTTAAVWRVKTGRIAGDEPGSSHR